MNVDDLREVCLNAAVGLIARHPRPLPASVVLPTPKSTEVITLNGFPDDDTARFDALEALAQSKMVPKNVPCWGFVCEAETTDEHGQQIDIVVVAYGARQRGSFITAAPINTDMATDAFSEPEPLAPLALVFLSALQTAADSAQSVPETSYGPFDQ